MISVAILARNLGARLSRSPVVYGIMWDVRHKTAVKPDVIRNSYVNETAFVLSLVRHRGVSAPESQLLWRHISNCSNDQLACSIYCISLPNRMASHVLQYTLNRDAIPMC